MAGNLDQFLNVTISTTSAQPQLANFGTPAILCYHVLNADYIRKYTSLADMLSDGFVVTDPAYYMATAILAQTPSVASFKIIRGSAAVVQAATFIVTDNTIGNSIGYSLMGTDGLVVDMHYTVPSAKTTTEIATAIAALTDPTGFTTTSSTATVTTTASVAGKIGYVSAVRGGTWLDTTPTAAPATDLNNALLTDTDWYGICGEHQDATNIPLVATWAESNKRLHTYTTADTNNLTAGTGVMYTLGALNRNYSFGRYSGTPVYYQALGLASQRFTATPGSDTWSYKQIAGAAADNLTASQIAALGLETAFGNRGNYCISVGGLSIERFGITGSGMYADLRRGIDALLAQIQQNVYSLLVTLPKVPYDLAGYAQIGAAVAAALQQYTATASNPQALLRYDPGFQWVVNLPATTAATTADRTARILRNVTFTAYAQNAVQVVYISGVVNT